MTSASTITPSALEAASKAAAALYTPSTPHARLVSLPLPLGIVFGDAGEEVVFVEELAPGGSAAAAGTVAVGDVVLGVAIPYGPCLRPLDGDGLAGVVAAVRTRPDGVMHLEVATWPGGPVAAAEARSAASDEALEMSWEDMAAVVADVEVDTYEVLTAEEAAEMDGSDERSWEALGEGGGWDNFESPEAFFAAK